jgi:excinuclease ABC subunit C
MIPPGRVLDLEIPDLIPAIANVPNTPGVYVLTPAEGSPYIGWTSHLGKRLARLLVHRTSSSNLLTNLRNSLAGVEYWSVGSRLEQWLLLYSLARKYDPDNYRKRLKLRAPWFLVLLAGDPYPRLSIQNRLPKQRVPAYGPFPRRDSVEQFEQRALGLFQIRRCTETLSPSPDHPGCIYGEMNLCMRPCQMAVSADEYRVEVSRVREFLESNGRHYLSVLSSARDRASAGTEFEEAARLHKQLEAVKSVLALRDDLVRDVAELNGVALTRASADRRLALWPMIAGSWQSPVFFDFSQHEADSKSLDGHVRETLLPHMTNPKEAETVLDHIAILSRWYYSSSCDGRWFGFRTPADLNYRKLVREISSLLKATPQLVG